MWKLRLMVAAAGCFLALAVVGPAPAAQGGDSNAGDVWVDDVGNPAGPGHEMDPHLACQDINLWGSGMADSSGTFTIDGWPPSGSQEQDYSGTWSYDPSKGGDQVLAVISASQLISTAQANGDAPKGKQGYHFKLQFSQDPQKHKTFWVDCSSAPAPTTATSTGTTTTTTVTTTSPPKTSVKGVKRKRHERKHIRKLHRRRRVTRHARILRGFTG